MKKRRLKKSVAYALYGLCFITVIGTVYMLQVITNPKTLEDESTYVDSIILDKVMPVVNITASIKRPYTASNITIGKYYYDKEDSEDVQKKSIIYYGDTFMPNSGVDYVSEEVFDVVSILDGVVTKVDENNLLGKIVEITHDNNLISVYQSLSEVTVNVGDSIMQGTVLGKSGEANISKDLKNHLHLELIKDSKNINPENYYDKKVDEL